MHVVVGPAESGPSRAAQAVFSTFQIPQVGYSATSSVLSDAQDYPFFLRVVPLDFLQTQVQTLAFLAAMMAARCRQHASPLRRTAHARPKCPPLAGRPWPNCCGKRLGTTG